MYRSEALFSEAFVSLLRSRGYMVQRIESAETGVGIPDVYAVKDGKHYWIESKNLPYQELSGSCFKVPWRKGQQAWAQAYRRFSGKVSYTVCALKETIAIIPMVKVFRGNIVQYSDCIMCDTVGSVERAIRLHYTLN